MFIGAFVVTAKPGLASRDWLLLPFLMIPIPEIIKSGVILCLVRVFNRKADSFRFEVTQPPSHATMRGGVGGGGWVLEAFAA